MEGTGSSNAQKISNTEIPSTTDHMQHQHIKNHRTSDESVNIVCFCWGTVIGLETTSRLEKNGVVVNLMIIDGSFKMVQDFLRIELKATNEWELHVSVLCLLMLKYYSEKIVESYKKMLAKCFSSEERLEIYVKAIQNFEPGNVECKRTEAIALYARIKESLVYEQTYGEINSPSILFKPNYSLYGSSLPKDYYLFMICSNFEGISYVEGNHISIPENRILAEAIETFIRKNRVVKTFIDSNSRQ